MPLRTKLAWFLPIAASLSPAAHATMPEDVQGIVFEYALPKDPGRFAYCLRVDGHDASPAAFDHLRHTKLPLFKASDCKAVANPREGSIHRERGQAAIFYSLLNFKVDGPASATVLLEAYHHGLWGSGNTLRLERRDGTWHVVEVLPGWVS